MKLKRRKPSRSSERPGFLQNQARDARPNGRRGRVQSIFSTRCQLSFLEARVGLRSVAAGTYQVTEDLLVLSSHYIGGKAGLEFLAAILARDLLDILDRLYQVVELRCDN